MVPSFVEVTVKEDVPTEAQPVYIDLTSRGPTICVEERTDLNLLKRVVAALC